MQNVLKLACVFAERAAVLASSIVASGTKPGGRVGIYAPNCPNWMLTIQACNRSSLYVGGFLWMYCLGKEMHALALIDCNVTHEKCISSCYLGFCVDIVCMWRCWGLPLCWCSAPVRLAWWVSCRVHCQPFGDIHNLCWGLQVDVPGQGRQECEGEREDSCLLGRCTHSEGCCCQHREGGQCALSWSADDGMYAYLISEETLSRHGVRLAACAS